MSFQGRHPPPAPKTPPPICLCTRSSAHLGVTCLRPIIPMHPASPLSFSVHASPLQPSLAPVTPAGFLSPPYPCRFLNRFYYDPQLILCRLLPASWHPESPPSLVPCISCTNHPLTWVSPVSVPSYRCTQPRPYPSLSMLLPSNPPSLPSRLPDSCRRRTRAAS